MAPRPLELLYGMQLRGVPFIANSADQISQAFAGRVDIASGDAAVTVTTDVVEADSIILTGVESVVTAGSLGMVIEVKSINPGVAFVLGSADAKATIRPTTVMWLLFRT